MSGRVRRADGAVLPQAMLTLTDPSGHQIDLARSSDDGSYALHADEGHYLLICAAPPEAPSAKRITIIDGIVCQDVVLGRPLGADGV